MIILVWWCVVWGKGGRPGPVWNGNNLGTRYRAKQKLEDKWNKKNLETFQRYGTVWPFLESRVAGELGERPFCKWFRALMHDRLFDITHTN